MSDVLQTEQEIFELARKIETAEARAAYLKQACGGDTELEDRLTELLSIHDREDSLLDQGLLELGDTVESTAPDGHVGQSIGPYKLLQKIGEGGFGAVYMAEQTEPVRRKVALKVIKPGMDTREVIARFESERQALAMMNHPHIANVLDGGQTDEGRPYFVMELVRGVSLTEYCDRKRLPLADRLRLFMDVCRAVQHAHQKGIIHRDLKPSNVMVTLHDGTPVVKVIDFGVAKAINQQLTDKTLFTRYGQMVGTPQYMSPEQAEMSGLDVDTRSDIYSLGVLLYELLVGTTPLTEDRFRKVGYAEMQRLICEEDLAKPSNRLSTTGQQQLLDIAEHRGLTPDMLTDKIRGDLEWIVMKTLEKERDRRYSTALELSRDLERYLDDEPVEARAPSLGYRFRKYVRRNRGLVATATTIAIVLVAATTFSTGMWFVADHARGDAEQRLVELNREKIEKEAAFEREKRLATEVSLQASKLEKQLYRSQIGRANVLQSDGLRGEAKTILESCPPAHRDWEWDRLNLLTQRTAVTSVRGAQVPVFSANGDSFVNVGGDDDTRAIRRWDTKSGEQLDRMEIGGVDALGMHAVHPDEGTIAAAGMQGELFIVNFRDKKTLHSIPKAHDLRIDGMSFSPDGTRLATASWDGNLKLWNVQTGELEHTFTTEGSLRCAVFDPTGTLIATACRGNDIDTAMVWNTDTSELVANLHLKGGRVRTVAISPDGKLLGAAGSGGSVAIWDTTDWDVTREWTAHGDTIFSIVFSPDSHSIATSDASVVRIWRVARGGFVREFITDFSRIFWMGFSPDRKTFAVFGHSGLAPLTKVYDFSAPSTGGSLALPGLQSDFVGAGAFTHDGSAFAAGNSRGTIKVWNSVDGSDRWTLHGHAAPLFSLRWSPDGETLFSIDRIGWVRAWNMRDATTRWKARATDRPMVYALDRMAIGVDGQKLYIGTPTKGIAVIDTATGTTLQHLTTPKQKTFETVACSANGKILAAGSPSGQIRYWDTESYELVGNTNVRAIPRCLAFSPDSTRLAVGTVAGSVPVIDTVTREVLHRVRRIDDGRVWGVTFSASGKRVLVARDGLMTVVDAMDGEMICQWDTQECFNLAACHVTGNVAAFGGAGTVRLFASRQESIDHAGRYFSRLVESAISGAGSSGFANETIERLNRDPDLDAQVRLEAIRRLQNRGDEPQNLVAASLDSLLLGHSENYDLALKQATAAERLVPDHPLYRFALGLAQFRNGDLPLAKSTLQTLQSQDWQEYRKEQSDPALSLDGHVHALLAMIEHRDGDQESATANLAAAKTRLADNEAPDSRLSAVITEAERVLSGE